MISDFWAKKYKNRNDAFSMEKVILIQFYNKPLLITDFEGSFFTDTEFWVLIFLITNF